MLRRSGHDGELIKKKKKIVERREKVVLLAPRHGSKLFRDHADDSGVNVCLEFRSNGEGSLNRALLLCYVVW